MKEIAILYSGGTDSTCVAVLACREFEIIHLLTYKRFGIFSVDNATINIPHLKKRFPTVVFVNSVANIDALFKHISYESYFYYLRKYGFFTLSTCGLCKLAMHIQTIVYCLKNNIKYVWDGSNRYSQNGLSSDQMPRIVSEFRNMYTEHGITFTNPVFDLKEPSDIGWHDKANLKNLIPSLADGGKSDSDMTAGKILFDEKIFPKRNLKGSRADRRMQARCFQLLLNNIFVYGYCLPVYGEEKYRDITHRFLKEKIEKSKSIVKDCLKKRCS